MEDIKKDYVYACKVVLKCKNEMHIHTADELIKNFAKKWKSNYDGAIFESALKGMLIAKNFELIRSIVGDTEANKLIDDNLNNL